MDVQRMLNGLMKAGSQGESAYTVRPHFVSTKTFAAFAYVAAQVGYRYVGHAPGTGATNNPFFSFQRTPDARERAMAAVAAHPGMLLGGPLPGMRPGGGLRPLPEAQPEVDLLYSQMILDACSRYSRRVLGNLLILLIVGAVFLAFRGYTLDSVLLVGGAWLALFALYVIGLAVTRRRQATHRARLNRASAEWPPCRTR
ncbi:hypothetical protein [Streptomyces longisporoflavus]|uniref:Integral membrane protein n=1 Tax=Streptomyces longisporoflavus TaxID=28044 RepID=A0ABW7R0J8_9ACTN